MGPFQILLFVVWAVSAVALTILVLMHSGALTGMHQDENRPDAFR